MKYILSMSSDEFGAEDFRYDSLEAAVAGFGRLCQRIEELQDDIERWFRLCHDDETELVDERGDLAEADFS